MPAQRSVFLKNTDVLQVRCLDSLSSQPGGARSLRGLGLALLRARIPEHQCPEAGESIARHTLALDSMEVCMVQEACRIHRFIDDQESEGICRSHIRCLEAGSAICKPAQTYPANPISKTT